jgi:hypothetical protein
LYVLYHILPTFSQAIHHIFWRARDSSNNLNLVREEESRTKGTLLTLFEATLETMSVAFWCITLKGGKSEEVQPPEGYVLNVQQCAIVGKPNESAVLQVNTTSVEGDSIDAVICTLRVGTSDQVGLNLVFGYDVPASFSCTGKGELHVSGYYQPGPLEDDDEMDEYGEYGEEGEDDESDSDEVG